MENNNYDNPYAPVGVGTTVTTEAIVENEKENMSGKNKVWMVILSIWSLANGVIGLMPLFLSIFTFTARKVFGRWFYRLGLDSDDLYCMPWEKMSHILAFSMIINFVCGLIAIVAFVMGKIAYKKTSKYGNSRITTMAKIAKIVGLVGIIFNALLGVIFIISHI